METIKILIVDDHPMMREALRDALIEESDLEVVGEADNGLDGLKLARELAPDVILMDLLMPEMGGLDAVARLRQEQPQVKIMVISSLENEEKILAAVQAGALGYFPKTAPRAYLVEGVRKVADGIPYLPAGIAAKLFKSLREMQIPIPARSALNEPLTARQAEILALVGEGRSDHEIGKILHLSVATVRSHVHNITQRLGLETRGQAAAYAGRVRKG
jgi:NarL family two-component system response regulator LiaR